MYPREFFDTFWRPDIRNEVFVAMSFAPEFSETWEKIIKPAIENVPGYPLKAVRVDASHICGSILTDIMDGIAHAKLVICEISPYPVALNDKPVRNPNVMYEMGLAHALRQKEEVIIIRQDDQQINFDIASVRVLRYDAADHAKASGEIRTVIQSNLKEIDYKKMIKVQMAIDTLPPPAMHFIRQFYKDDSFGLSYFEENSLSILINRSDLAFNHLLDQKILRLKCVTPDNSYYYTWTNFGQSVIQQMKVRHIIFAK